VVTQTGLQAIWALVNLAEARDGVFVGSREVARTIGARPNYLSKLLQTLAREGLVVSQRGTGGGFRLARESSKITLLDVLTPLDQIDRWERCVLGLGECSEKASCLAHDRWTPLKTAYLALLSDLTIADLVRHDSRPMLDRVEAPDAPA
jgi:Rrf2 family iron-sulfur cluster assembly transcriptional regulator